MIDNQVNILESAAQKKVSITRILTLDSDRINEIGNLITQEGNNLINQESKIGVILGNNYDEIRSIDKS